MAANYQIGHQSVVDPTVGWIGRAVAGYNVSLVDDSQALLEDELNRKSIDVRCSSTHDRPMDDETNEIADRFSACRSSSTDPAAVVGAAKMPPAGSSAVVAGRSQYHSIQQLSSPSASSSGRLQLQATRLNERAATAAAGSILSRRSSPLTAAGADYRLLGRHLSADTRQQQPESSASTASIDSVLRRMLQGRGQERPPPQRLFDNRMSGCTGSADSKRSAQTTTAVEESAPEDTEPTGRRRHESPSKDERLSTVQKIDDADVKMNNNNNNTRTSGDEKLFAEQSVDVEKEIAVGGWSKTNLVTAADALRVRRARVESILSGIIQLPDGAQPPAAVDHDAVRTSSTGGFDTVRKRKRKQHSPQQQQRDGCRFLDDVDVDDDDDGNVVDGTPSSAKIPRTNDVGKDPDDDVGDDRKLYDVCQIESDDAALRGESATAGETMERRIFGEQLTNMERRLADMQSNFCDLIQTNRRQASDEEDDDDDDGTATRRRSCRQTSSQTLNESREPHHGDGDGEDDDDDDDAAVEHDAPWSLQTKMAAVGGSGGSVSSADLERLATILKVELVARVGSLVDRAVRIFAARHRRQCRRRRRQCVSVDLASSSKYSNDDNRKLSSPPPAPPSLLPAPSSSSPVINRRLALTYSPADGRSVPTASAAVSDGRCKPVERWRFEEDRTRPTTSGNVIDDAILHRDAHSASSQRRRDPTASASAAVFETWNRAIIFPSPYYTSPFLFPTVIAAAEASTGSSTLQQRRQQQEPVQTEALPLVVSTDGKKSKAVASKKKKRTKVIDTKLPPAVATTTTMSAATAPLVKCELLPRCDGSVSTSDAADVDNNIFNASLSGRTGSSGVDGTSTFDQKRRPVHFAVDETSSNTTSLDLRRFETVSYSDRSHRQTSSAGSSPSRERRVDAVSPRTLLTMDASPRSVIADSKQDDAMDGQVY